MKAIKTTKHRIIIGASIEKQHLLKAIRVIIALAPFVWLGLWVAKPIKQPISPLSKTQPAQANSTPQEPTGRVKIWKGLASWYGTGPGECLGCSSTQTMANGERLNDSKLTVAFNKVPLNSTVTIYNPKTGQSIKAKVTDRGGFEKYGKIIDLNKATKNALGCADVCQVIIKQRSK